MSWFKQIVSLKKAALAEMATQPMQVLSDQCIAVWHEPDKLELTLQQAMQYLPNCHLIYAVDANGIMLTSNIHNDELNREMRGVSLAGRPFMSNTLPFQGLTLSHVYVSQFNLLPCITIMQVIKQGEQVMGFVAADFSVNDLPAGEAEGLNLPGWNQYRGDPSIRSTLFLQERTHSAMDQRLDEVVQILTNLMQYRGVFHMKVHFSSSRASCWSMANPYCYQIHTLDELVDSDLGLAYPERAYPDNAIVPQNVVGLVLNLLKVLRNADENVYLRSASFNLVNGMVGLTFSCDGTLHINYQELLATDVRFWFGQAVAVTKKAD